MLKFSISNFKYIETGKVFDSKKYNSWPWPPKHLNHFPTHTFSFNNFKKIYPNFLKHILDYLLALLTLVILSPLFVILSIILLLTGEHKVLFFQKRVGYKNSRFKMWKYVTMMKHSSKMGTGSLTIRNDPRVLPIGKFLRRTKINELPQIVNVLIGNMSIVGPRPQVEIDFYLFPDHIQKVIYNTMPGITGIGSIIFRDEEKWISKAPGDKHEFYKEHIAPYKGEVEVWYLDNISFYTDTMIIFLTAWSIIAPKSELIYSVFKDLPPRPAILN